MGEPAGKIPISAVLIVLNGERHLDRVLTALAFCAEILIVDSGSTDRTRETAARHGARVEHQPFLGYGAQKQRAVELARHDWVLVVDDDEVLDPTAAAAIAGLDLGDRQRAWRLRRRTFVGAREIRHGQWSPDFSLRLFHRAVGRFNAAAIHESVEHPGPLLDLPGALLHYSFTDLADLFARMATYSRAKAGRYRAAGRRSGPLRLIARAKWGFFRSYILKLGCLDGAAGVVVALSVAIDAVLGLAMAGEDADEPEAGSRKPET